MEFLGEEVFDVVTARLAKTARSPVKWTSPARLSALSFLVLAVASWAYILADDDSGFGDLVSAQSWDAAAEFVGELVGKGSDATPAFLRWSRWTETAELAYRTLAMSVLAIGIAGGGVLVTFLPAARNVASDDVAATPSPVWRALYFLVRGVFIGTRGIPELLLATIVVFFFSPGILPGAIALGLHNYGIVGKLSAEVVENLDPRPARALRTAGASRFQVLFYGIMPQALPQFLTYLLYRWEVVIRTTIVVGFVGAGGLGREFRLDMSFFRYTDVVLLLVWYVLLVVAVDLVSMYLRRLAR